MSTKIIDTIIPEQSRAARGMVSMTQTTLAKAAGLSLSTIVDFEKERREISKSANVAVRTALERAGIEFIDENGGGPGVRLRGGSTNDTPRND